MGILSLLGFGEKVIKEALRKGAVVIDVRTPAEFDRGHIPESLNIPVDRVASFAETIKAMNRLVIFCDDTGARSSMAKQFLLAKGMRNGVYIGGSWERVLRISRKL